MSKDTRMDRRTFMGTLSAASASLAAGGLAASSAASAGVQFPERRGPIDMSFGAGGSVGGGVYRSENDLYDCEV